MRVDEPEACVNRASPQSPSRNAVAPRAGTRSIRTIARIQRRPRRVFARHRVAASRIDARSRYEGCIAEGVEHFEWFVGAAVLANNLMRFAELLRERAKRRSKRTNNNCIRGAVTRRIDWSLAQAHLPLRVPSAYVNIARKKCSKSRCRSSVEAGENPARMPRSQPVKAITSPSPVHR
jgi:hypothetical protein